MRKVLLSTIILAFTTTSTLAVPIGGASLNSTTAATLTQDQCASMVGPQNIPVSVIPSLSYTCLKAIGHSFTNSQTNALTSAQISNAFDAWTDAQLRKLTGAQIVGLPATQTSRLTTYFSSWSEGQIQALTPAQIALIPADVFGYPWFPDVFAKFSDTQVASISDLAILKLAKYPTSIVRVPASLISSLSADEVVNLAALGYIRNLSYTQLVALPVGGVRWLERRGLMDSLSESQRKFLPSTDVTLTATRDTSCAHLLVPSDATARYTTQKTKPSPSESVSANYQNATIGYNGNFTVPYAATYLYFVPRPTIIGRKGLKGVDDTLYSVGDGGPYLVKCTY